MEIVFIYRKFIYQYLHKCNEYLMFCFSKINHLLLLLIEKGGEFLARLSNITISFLIKI